MAGIRDLAIIEHGSYVPKITNPIYSLAASLLHEKSSIAIVYKNQLATQRRALYTLFDNAELVVEQKKLVEEFVSQNTLQEKQISLLSEFFFGIVSLGLCIDTITYLEDAIHITIVHDDATLKLQIDALCKIHTSFNRGSQYQLSLEDGRLPHEHLPSFDVYLQDLFKLDQ